MYFCASLTESDGLAEETPARGLGAGAAFLGFGVGGGASEAAGADSLAGSFAAVVGGAVAESAGGFEASLEAAVASPVAGAVAVGGFPVSEVGAGLAAAGALAGEESAPGCAAVCMAGCPSTGVAGCVGAVVDGDRVGAVGAAFA